MGIRGMTKEQGTTISVATVFAILASLITAYPTAKNVLAGEIESQIKQQTQPLTDAFYVIVLQNIQNQQNSITAMEFKRDHCLSQAECWTLRDAQDLEGARRTLQALQSAKMNLEKK